MGEQEPQREILPPPQGLFCPTSSDVPGTVPQQRSTSLDLPVQSQLPGDLGKAILAPSASQSSSGFQGLSAWMKGIPAPVFSGHLILTETLCHLTFTP